MFRKTANIDKGKLSNLDQLQRLIIKAKENVIYNLKRKEFRQK